MLPFNQASDFDLNGHWHAPLSGNGIIARFDSQQSLSPRCLLLYSCYAMDSSFDSVISADGRYLGWLHPRQAPIGMRQSLLAWCGDFPGL